MNDEIKEILDRFEKLNVNILYPFEMEASDCKKLLDYITNLQQENETRQQDINNLTYQLAKMKEENERLKEKLNIDLKWALRCDDLLKEKNDYKSRCEKAIEYIKYNDSDLYTYEPDYDYEENIVDNYEPSSFREDLSNILQNGSEKDD